MTNIKIQGDWFCSPCLGYDMGRTTEKFMLDFRLEQDIFLSSKASRTNMKPSQLPIQ